MTICNSGEKNPGIVKFISLNKRLGFYPFLNLITKTNTFYSMQSNGMNWIAILVAGIAAWALGALWYSPVLFGKAWQKESGLTEQNIKNANMPLIFGTSAVMMIIMSAGLALFFQGDETMNVMKGLKMGFLTGLLFVATSTAINYLYQRKSFRLWLIDAAYQVALLTLSGAIIGAWR